MNTRDEFRNVPVTEVGVARWAWSTHVTAADSLLPAADSMQAGLAAATDDGRRDSDLRVSSLISPQTGLGAKPV